MTSFLASKIARPTDFVSPTAHAGSNGWVASVARPPQAREMLTSWTRRRKDRDPSPKKNPIADARGTQAWRRSTCTRLAQSRSETRLGQCSLSDGPPHGRLRSAILLIAFGRRPCQSRYDPTIYGARTARTGSAAANTQTKPSVQFWFNLERAPLDPHLQRSMEMQMNLRPAPFYVPPPKRQRIDQGHSWLQSIVRYHVNKVYSYVEWQGLANPRWVCEQCGADFLLVTTSEAAKFALGIQEVALHAGGRSRWGEPCECARCGVEWVRAAG